MAQYDNNTYVILSERNERENRRERHLLKKMSNYYVYILTNASNNVLYVGVTNNIERRVAEHKNKTLDGFSKRYNLTKCVYVESCSDVSAAIAREKQLKSWNRQKKFDLINLQNPEMSDLGFEIDGN